MYFIFNAYIVSAIDWILNVRLAVLGMDIFSGLIQLCYNHEFLTYGHSFEI